MQKAIIKEIERYYLLEKQGKGYWTREKYVTSKEKIDNRKNNGTHVKTTKYETILDQLFLDWLLSENILGNAITTRNQLFVEENGVINIPILRENYKELQSIGHEAYAKKQDMSKGLVLTYSQKVRKITETHLETVLKRLQKQDVIKWQKNIMVKYFIGELEIADKELEADIKKAEYETYDKQKIKPFERVNPKVNKKFINAVCENFSGMSSYWRVYNIDILDDEVIEKSELDDDKRIELKNKLINLYICSAVDATKNNKIKDNNIKENALGKNNIKATKYKPYASPKYVDDINKLNRLIWLVPDGWKSESEEFIEAFAEFNTDSFTIYDDDLPW